jgi:AcrR family transcriptional regulator
MTNIKNQRAAHKATERALVRKNILDQASALLTEEGPHALSMRKLSQRVGASTIVLYTYFKDKPDILNELYLEGFARLQQDLEAVAQGDDPMRYVWALGHAYRRSAVANSTYYQIMFSRCVPGFTPSEQNIELSKRSFLVLRQGVQRCADAGIPLLGGVGRTAQVLWSTLHGVISLELFGYVGNALAGEALLEQAIQTISAGMAKLSKTA